MTAPELSLACPEIVLWADAMDETAANIAAYASKYNADLQPSILSSLPTTK
jgi:hypothetical protein